jgi:hypothetical protein
MSSNILSTHTDIAIASDARFRMSGQNRTRYLNSIASAQPAAEQGDIAVTTWTTIALGAEEIDTDTIHDLVTDNSHLTLPLVGKWSVKATLFLNYAGVTNPIQVGVRIIKNGGTSVIYGDCSADVNGSNTDAAVSASADIVTTATSDYVEMQGICIGDSGTWLTDATLGLTRLSAHYIGE